MGGLGAGIGAGDGGDGGCEANLAGGDGLEPNDNTGRNAGGGGGAVGRIRLNGDTTGVLGILSPSVASGSATVGGLNRL